MEGDSELCWSQKSEGNTCPSLLHCQQEPSPSPRGRGSACCLCLPRKSPRGQAKDTALLGPRHPWGHGSLGPPLHLGGQGNVTSARLRDLSRAHSQQDRELSPLPPHRHVACQAHYWDPGRRQSPEWKRRNALSLSSTRSQADLGPAPGKPSAPMKRDLLGTWGH